MKQIFLTTLVLIFLVSCSDDDNDCQIQNQNTIYVDASATTPGDGTETYPFLTIQEAVDEAKSGDVVLVKSGTYRESISIDKNGISLRAEDNTLLTQDGYNATIYISGDQVEVSGFEIANSNSDDLGAIHVQEASFITLSDNRIHDNPNAAAYWLVGTKDVTIDGGQLIDNRGGVMIEGTTNNLTIRNVEILSTEIILMQQGDTTQSSQYFGIINAWDPVGGSNWLFENVTIRGTVTYGIELRSRSETYPQENPITNLTIRNCLLEQNGYGYAADGYPSTNYAPEYYYGNVLIQGLSGVLVENSIFREGGDWGIDFYKTDNIIVRNNIFANNGMRTPHTEIGDGLEVNGGRNNKVFNNVFYGNPNSGLFLSYLIETQGELHSPTSLVANNIAWNNGEGDLSIFGPTPEDPHQGFYATHILHNNLFGTRGVWGPVTESNGLTANPNFTDPANYNFTLQASSPAVDNGWALDNDVPTTDMNGANRPQGAGIDLGVFEY
ncbi:hypothetical protein E1176_12545 [Fulvivirga sp. RKSG066]|uniref:right-handed parallel beta-helix repeat-containing protein n=1 Tax=Fulvivirga aurantia TaxID=2529383 RepID=UPI0012BB7949|nr:right-handed parallel beta-helix repeat-containing protein [Fulvivirga aurantia]MTI21853.1 hypothetical protein [Fulvivirga aurantia]